MAASYFDTEHREGAIRVVTETDRIVVVSLEGELDLGSAPALDDQVGVALDGGNHLILDLSGSTFIDSSIVSVLMRAAKSAHASKQAIVLQLGTAAIVERLLDVIGVEAVLPRAGDRQEAVRMIRERVLP